MAGFDFGADVSQLCHNESRLRFEPYRLSYEALPLGEPQRAIGFNGRRHASVVGGCAACHCAAGRRSRLPGGTLVEGPAQADGTYCRNASAHGYGGGRPRPLRRDDGTVPDRQRSARCGAGGRQGRPARLRPRLRLRGQCRRHPRRRRALFRIASISKPITAAAILRLVEMGKLKFDEPVFALLKIALPRPVPDPRLKKITDPPAAPAHRRLGSRANRSTRCFARSSSPRSQTRPPPAEARWTSSAT